ncbi:MAG: alkaline phosphatase family protein [Clostridia bacterium]|nr:alkaline phosphatase family protein [Clostridia bacterium]
MKNKLIVISADALVAEDMELFKTLPNFKKYLSGGACVRTVKTCYPTVTYPAHATIASGLYPDRHGITGNDIFSTEIHKERPWCWFHDAVKGEDIFTCAKRAGLSTAAVFWPCTGNHPDIDYLIDEYWSQGEGDTRRAAFRRSGSSEEVMKIVDKYVDGFRERYHPGADVFVIRCAADIIREFKPDLIMIHPANIDGYRHGNGLFNEKVNEGVRETDEWLGIICRAAEEAGTLDHTSIVLLSDHGQLEIKRAINLNVLLADAGFITVENGIMTACKAFCRSCGMMAQCYVFDRSCKDEVRAYLDHLCEEGIYGISEVMTEEECRAKHRLGGDFDFALETDGYTTFGEAVTRPLVANLSNSDYRLGRATHGYLPDKGPQPVFYAKGPAFRNGAELQRCNTVDEAPTLAKALGFDMKDTDGRVLNELLV